MFEANTQQELINFILAHWELCLAFVLILAYWIISEILELKSGHGITPAHLIHLMNRENAMVIDVRDSQLFEAGHILGAVSFPEKIILTKLNQLKKYQSKPVILVDAHGIVSNKLINKIISQGFEKALYLKNGMQSWRQAKLPLELLGKSEKLKKLKIEKKNA